MSSNFAAGSEADDLAFAVSHDLRANLRHISAYTALVREELPAGAAPELHKYLNVVTQAASNLGQQLDGLVAYTAADQTVLTSNPIDMKRLVLEVYASFKPKADARHIEFKTPADLPAVQGDAVLVRQILSSLISNAIKFTQKTAQPHIEFGCSAETDGKVGVFFIKDNGVGFDPKQAAKLFRLFQRLHNSSDYEGLGVGLALTRKWVARHGGRAWAQAAPGEGCQISFELPLALPSSAS